MTDTTPPPVSNDPSNDGYEIRNAEEASRDDDDERREGQDKARTIGQRISDAIEDAIPGDSDNDGH